MYFFRYLIVNTALKVTSVSSYNMNNKGSFEKNDYYLNLDRVNEWLKNADSKTSFILTFVGIFITLLFSNKNVKLCVFLFLHDSLSI